MNLFSLRSFICSRRLDLHLGPEKSLNVLTHENKIHIFVLLCKVLDICRIPICLNTGLYISAKRLIFGANAHNNWYFFQIKKHSFSIYFFLIGRPNSGQLSGNLSDFSTIAWFILVLQQSSSRIIYLLNMGIKSHGMLYQVGLWTVYSCIWWP